MLRPYYYRSPHEFAPNALHTKAQNNYTNPVLIVQLRHAFLTDLWYADNFVSNKQKPNAKENTNYHAIAFKVQGIITMNMYLWNEKKKKSETVEAHRTWYKELPVTYEFM